MASNAATTAAGASILCSDNETVVQHWLANKPAHTKRDKVQDGGPGNGLLMSRYADYYNGSRFWTDGITIFSYTTALARNDNGIMFSNYYTAGKYSNTTSKHVKALRFVLNIS